MLSYQHGYHAGNAADVHKHALLAAMLDYLTRKPKPLTYLETHAGRGLYRLDAPEALKTGEAAAGIGRMAAAFSPDSAYGRALAGLRAAWGAQSYPGSPLIAAALLRPDDRMVLAELHPQEHAALHALLSERAQVVHEDGFRMALSRLPPEPRRGLMLIDPSYEVKADYAAMPARIAALHGKWNVGVIALWYPILADGRHRQMLAALQTAGLPGCLRHELAFPPARPGHGMTGSGMFVVNAPFGLAAAADDLSARLAALPP